jgi:hypothetical protein
MGVRKIVTGSPFSGLCDTDHRQAKLFYILGCCFEVRSRRLKLFRGVTGLVNSGDK